MGMKHPDKAMQMERGVGPLVTHFVGIFFAVLVISYFVYHSGSFSPEAFRTDTLTPLPF